MYSVNVRDHLMIAHSFRGEVFGPAQRLHGATYVVDVTFMSEELDDDGVVVDIGLASNGLSSVLEDLQYKNLDDDPVFKGKNTSSEFLAREIFNRLVSIIKDGKFGKNSKQLTSLRVMLRESHLAWGSYEGQV